MPDPPYVVSRVLIADHFHRISLYLLVAFQPACYTYRHSPCSPRYLVRRTENYEIPRAVFFLRFVTSQTVRAAFRHCVYGSSSSNRQNMSQMIFLITEQQTVNESPLRSNGASCYQAPKTVRSIGFRCYKAHLLVHEQILFCRPINSGGTANNTDDAQGCLELDDLC